VEYFSIILYKRSIEKERLDELHNEYNKLNVNLQKETEERNKQIKAQDDTGESMKKSSKAASVYSAQNNLLSIAINEVCKGLGIQSSLITRGVSNVRTIAAAKNSWLTITKTLTTAQKLLATGGILAVVAAIGAAIVAYRKHAKEKKEANKTTTEFNVELGKEQRIVNDLFNAYNKTNPQTDKHRKIKQAIIDRYGEYIKHLLDEKGNITDIGEALRIVNERLQTQIALKIRNKALEGSITERFDTYTGGVDKMMTQIGKQVSDPQKLGEIRKYLNSQISKFIDADRGELSSMVSEISQSLQNQFGLKNIYAGIGENIGFSINNLANDMQKANKTVADTKAQYDGIIDQIITVDDLIKKDGKKNDSKEKQEEKATTSLEKKAYDYQKRIDAARVKAIHDGAEKERQAAKAEFDQTQAFIEKELKEIAALEKKTGKPADQQRTMLLSLDVEATRQYEAELGRINAQSKATLNEIFTEVNARFASELEQNKTDITSYYDHLIKEATKAGATLDEIDQLRAAKQKDIDRAGIHDQLRKIDLDEALEMEKANNLASIGLTTIAEQTKYEIVKKYLKDRIDLLRKLGDESSNKEADVLEARLKGLQSSPKSISGLVNGALFDKIKKGFEKVTDSEEEAEQKTTSLFSSFQQGGAQAVAAINEIKGVFGGLDEGLDKALDALGGIAECFASGGIAGGAMAIIGQGIKMFTSAAQVEKEHQKALKELALAKLEMQREYNLLLLKEQLYYKQGANIFGANQIRGAANSILTYRDSIAQLKKEMQGEKPNEAMGAAFEKMANSKNGLVASMGKQRLDEYKKQLDAYNKGIGALADVDIVTGSRKSGWGFWKKRKDVYSGLLDTYDDVIDKEGKLNTNRIQAILNTHKMSDENRALLESLLNLDEAAKEAEEQLKSYLTQTFGGLGDALADSIVTAFKTGEDAAQLFKGNVTDVLNDIAKQMVFGLYLKDTFDKLEKDIHNAYEDLADDKLTEQQLSEKITNILGGFFGGLDGDIDKANKFLEEFWKNAEANGFDRPEGERQGATGGFASASQDSIFELNGHVYATRQMIGDIRSDQREELLIQRTIMGQIALLVERSEYWEHLEQLPKVVQKLEDIETYGLPVKLGK